MLDERPRRFDPCDFAVGPPRGDDGPALSLEPLRDGAADSPGAAGYESRAQFPSWIGVIFKP